MSETKVKKFAKNVAVAFIAQGISLIASVLTSLFIPKLLGVEQFSYWQLFIFYSGYVGFFHFGLSDGIYLRYGGKELEELDKPMIGSQYRLMTSWQIVLCIIMLPVLILTTSSPERRIVWACIAVYMLLANIACFWGFVYQAANRTRVYSVQTIISKVAFIFCIALLLFLHYDQFELYIILFIASHLVAALYCIIKSKDFIFAKGTPLKEAVSEAWINIRVGINLTISNIASSLILGIGRIFVDMTQEITEFGLLSFAISLTNFFLQFISQVSMVMFPALRQIEPNKARQLFISLRRNSSYLLCFIMVLFVPMRKILGMWLPQYEVSLNYLTWLLPICIFDGKMQLLYSTYLKVLRKEKSLLAINIISLAVSALLCALSTFVLESLNALVVTMVFCIALRSILSNIVISRNYELSVDSITAWECILSVVFIVSNMYLGLWKAGAIYLAAYCIFMVFNRRYIADILRMIKEYRAKR